MSYHHFTLEERKCIQDLLAEGRSMRYIAKILERSPSSISREIARNRAKYRPHHKLKNSYWYNFWRANILAITRRRNKRRVALIPGTPQWNFVIAGLKKFWSPEAISNRWMREFPNEKKLCASTIYRYIARKDFPEISAKKNLRRRDKKKQTRNACYSSIQPDSIIPEWPDEIRNRSEIGHWEGDTVYGKMGKGLLTTLVDRKARLVKLCKILRRNATETRLALEKSLRGLPVASISLDNGSEFAEFHELEANLSTVVYFAEPHKPWQRGSNENINGIIRFFFPKGTDFTKVTDEEIQRVEDLLNNRPRKCLGWRTPAEVFFEGVALA